MKGKFVFRCFKSWFEFWWFPNDPWRKGKGFWQICGHFFEGSIMETVWFFGRYCGQSISNAFVHIDLRWKFGPKIFSPLLTWILRDN